MEFRKVQRAGQSTFLVSLPRDWVGEVGLKQGDLVSILREEDGSLHLYPRMIEETEEAPICLVDARQCDRPGLLTRVITGLYVLGYDTIKVTSAKEFRPEHLGEIRKVIERLTGIGVVEQSVGSMTIQSFVDSTKFPVIGLLRRLHTITVAMLDAAMRALVEGKPGLAHEAVYMEDEVDRIYWLVVRQLLLAIKNRSIGKKLGIENPVTIAGNRLIAKAFEEMGDHCEGMAREALSILEKGGKELYEKWLTKIQEFYSHVKQVYDQTTRAIFTLNSKLANDALEMAEGLQKEERALAESILILRGEIDKGVESVNLVSVLMGLRVYVWNLGQIWRHCSTIGEIAINRSLEQSSNLCTFLKAESASSDLL